MINVKDQVYSAICSADDYLDVSDVYPRDWTAKYCCQLVEEDNSVIEKTDNAEQKARLRFALYIWSDHSLSALKVAIDEKVSALGLVRTMCQDVNDPSGRRHAVMRYEGIIDVNTEQVYWNFQ